MTKETKWDPQLCWKPGRGGVGERPLQRRRLKLECKVSASEEGELLAPDSEVISSLSSSTAVVVVLKVGARMV